jgi:5-methylcytosine-specific restriction endonuclease McrA
VCPGYGVPAHPAADLQLDHVLAISEGGAPFERANAAVLCKTCNTRKGGANRKRTDRTRGTGGTHLKEQDPARAIPGVLCTRLGLTKNSSGTSSER